LVERAEDRIRSGIVAYTALQEIRADGTNQEARDVFEEYWPDLGYGLLLKKYRVDIENATEDEIVMAAQDTVPGVWPLFWTFRIMMGLGFFYIAFFALWFYRASRGWIATNKPLLWFSAVTLPLPWIAIESGWFIAEFGRQPWVVEGVLPTFYAASGLTLLDIILSLSLFVLIYSVLLVIMIILMIRVVRAGPKDDFFAGNSKAEDDEDFVIAALPATPATKELGS